MRESIIVNEHKLSQEKMDYYVFYVLPNESCYKKALSSLVDFNK
jgi:hypothetical protein